MDNTQNLLPSEYFYDSLNHEEENFPSSDDFNGSTNESDKGTCIN